MTCNQFWDWSTSDNEILRERAERHFAQCEDCRTARVALELSLSQLAHNEPLRARHRRLWLSVMDPATTAVPVVAGNVGRSTSRNWQASPQGALAAVCTVAAATICALAMSSTPKNPGTPGMSDKEAVITSTQSPVTVIPLTWTLCFGHIEQDLEAAEERVQRISEALSLVELQREVEHTLEQLRQWGD